MPKTKKAAPFGANRAVAHNLRLARELVGWTQEQAAEELEKWLGVRWSMASWSAAEHSADGVRPRQFSADEIVAFSLTFRLPIAWWFLPPDDPKLMGEHRRKVLITAQIARTIELQDAYLERLRGLLEAIEIIGFPRSLTFQVALEEAREANARADLVELKRTLADLSTAIDRMVLNDEGSDTNGKS